MSFHQEKYVGNIIFSICGTSRNSGFIYIALSAFEVKSFIIGGCKIGTRAI